MPKLKVDSYTAYKVLNKAKEKLKTETVLTRGDFYTSCCRRFYRAYPGYGGPDLIDYLNRNGYIDIIDVAHQKSETIQRSEIRLTNKAHQLIKKIESLHSP